MWLVKAGSFAPQAFAEAIRSLRKLFLSSISCDCVSSIQSAYTPMSEGSDTWGPGVQANVQEEEEPEQSWELQSRGMSTNALHARNAPSLDPYQVRLAC